MLADSIWSRREPYPGIATLRTQEGRVSIISGGSMKILGTGVGKLARVRRARFLLILSVTAFVTGMVAPVFVAKAEQISRAEKKAMLQDALRLVQRLQRRHARPPQFPQPRNQGKWDVVLELTTEQLTEKSTKNRSGLIGASVAAFGGNSFLHTTEQNGGGEALNIGRYGFGMHSWRSQEGFDLIDSCNLQAEYTRQNENVILAVYGFGLKKKQVIVPKRTAYRGMVRNLFRQKVREYRRWQHNMRRVRRSGNPNQVALLRNQRPSTKISKRELKQLLKRALNEDVLRSRVWLNTRFNDPVCAVLDAETYQPIEDATIDAFFAQVANPVASPDENE